MIPARSLFILIAFAIVGAAPELVAAAPPRALPANPSNAAVTADPALMPATGADRNKPLAVGDQVTLQIVEDRSDAVARRVTDTGELDVPYVGRIRAIGKTTNELAAEIKRKLEADYYYTATVRLGIDLVNRAASLGKVFVSGEVRNPGPQEFYAGDKPMASAAILRAGSFTQFADKRRVMVVRKTPDGGSRNYEADMKAVLEQGDVEKDLLLEDGDYIIVKRRLINW